MEDAEKVVGKMDPEKKKEWVAALRSGKYTQGRGRLKSAAVDNCFCVMGVLHEISGLGTWNVAGEYVVREVSENTLVYLSTQRWRARGGRKIFWVGPEVLGDLTARERELYLECLGGEVSVMHPCVARWAGITLSPTIRMDDFTVRTLGSLNDTGKYDFHQLAHLIEVQL